MRWLALACLLVLVVACSQADTPVPAGTQPAPSDGSPRGAREPGSQDTLPAPDATPGPTSPSLPPLPQPSGPVSPTPSTVAPSTPGADPTRLAPPPAQTKGDCSLCRNADASDPACGVCPQGLYWIRYGLDGGMWGCKCAPIASDANEPCQEKADCDYDCAFFGQDALRLGCALPRCLTLNETVECAGITGRCSFVPQDTGYLIREKGRAVHLCTQ